MSLRREGINLPLSDLAIAALAIEHTLAVFTLDKHFEKIPGLRIYKWTASTQLNDLPPGFLPVTYLSANNTPKDTRHFSQQHLLIYTAKLH